MRIKLSNYISNFFVEKGIKDCFMVTGGGAMHLCDAFGHEKNLNVIYNHNEQGCSIASEGYARYSGKIAPVIVTSGPGGTNAITGVMGAYLDSIPMFVISGQVKYETTIHSCKELNLRQLGDQEFNITESVKNMTKYAVLVKEKNEIAYHLEKAYFLALNGRMGPVWLDIPLDVQGAYIETDDLKHFDEKEIEIVRTNIDEDVNFVLEKIKNAKAPLILAGTGVHLSKTENSLLTLVKKLNIPLATAWNAKDLIDTNDDLFVGMPGTVGDRPSNFAIQNCDLLLILGCRMNIRIIGYNRFDFAKNAYKIMVDIDNAELNKPTLKIDKKICANLTDFFSAILSKKYDINANHQKFIDYCMSLKNKYPTVLESYYNGNKLNPYVFIEKLFENLNEKDKIVCGNGSACVITFQAAKIKQGMRMFTNSGCAAMGYGLPAALGVATYDNDNRTICIDGDGSIMMNLQELATISHNKLNVKIFIINNNGYHSIRQTQNNLFKPPLVGVDKTSGISFPDFNKLADAFNINYSLITSISDIDNNIKNILDIKGPTIIEVIVDEKQNFEPKSSSKVMPDGKIISPSIDDMFPFLSHEEYEKAKFNIEK